MKPKKSLGQNFLTSGKAVFEIVKAGEITKDDLILEIGPGKGALTEKILETGAKLIAIEKDRELIPFLQEKFEKEIKEKRFILLEEDILKMNIKKILAPTSPTPPKEGLQTIEQESKENPLLGRGQGEVRYKLIANIPYYITGAIIEKFLSLDKKPEKLVLLVQKEVAERVVARDKKESILSLAVKLYGNPKIVYKVSAGSFFPKPKVDSAVLVIDTNKEKISKNLEETYFKIVKSAFSHKRKIMLSNLKNDLPNINWENIFQKLNIDKKVRAENLNKDIFLEIARIIK